MSDEFDDLDAALAAHREKVIADMKRMVGAADMSKWEPVSLPRRWFPSDWAASLTCWLPARPKKDVPPRTGS